MANALESASLVMIPSGYEDGTLGSLKPTDGTGDFTFTRGSDISATRIKEDGYIEKGYENLLLQSNTFSDVSWTKNRVSVTGSQQGYDGSNDAWLVNRDNVNSNGVLIKFQSLNSVQNLSVYAKANTLNWVRIRIGTGGRNAYFDLSNGTTPTSEASIESVGNGWYRCSIWDSYSSDRYRIYPADGNGDTSGTSGSIYIQDAMLNQGLVAYPYIETTTAAKAGGILEDMPRLDYSNGSCPALLLEPSRTNAFPNSEYFDGSHWIKGGNADIENNAAISPEGIRNASKFYCSTTSYTFTRLQGDGALFRQGRTLSVFAKAGEVSEFLFFSGNLGQGAFFNLNDGSLTGYYQGDSSEIDDAYSIDYGNGWYRYVVVFSANSYPRFFNSENQQITFNQTAGNGIYLYGFQAEQDATYPTSYIPTYGTSQTRGADDISTLDISSILGNDSYTIFLDVETENIGSSTNVAGDIFYLSVGSQTLAIDTRVSVIQDDSSSTTRIKVDVGDDITHYKAALKVTPTSATIFGNGIEGQSGTSRGLSPTSFNFYYSNKLKYNKILLFPTALSDDECIALTTI